MGDLAQDDGSPVQLGAWTVGDGPWTLVLYPAAGEASGSFRPRRRTARQQRQAQAEPVDGEVHGAGLGVTRARGKIRRYMVANGLNRLGTLTYAGEGCHEPKALRADVGAFFRSLRGGLGGERLPYLWVPEWHPGGHGLHVHFAVGRYVPRGLIETAWSHGFINIKLIGDLPVGSGQLEEARQAAGYLSKYALKEINRERPTGLHRYEVGQGFQPLSLHARGDSPYELIDLASTLMGRPPTYQWRSASSEAWTGPPVFWASWS